MKHCDPDISLKLHSAETSETDTIRPGTRDTVAST